MILPFVCCLESGSITFDLLAKLLQHIDFHAQPDQTSDVIFFLLLDGHGSHFEEPSMDYIMMICTGERCALGSLWNQYMAGR